MWLKLARGAERAGVWACASLRPVTCRSGFPFWLPAIDCTANHLRWGRFLILSISSDFGSPVSPARRRESSLGRTQAGEPCQENEQGPHAGILSPPESPIVSELSRFSKHSAIPPATPLPKPTSGWEMPTGREVGSETHPPTSDWNDQNDCSPSPRGVLLLPRER